jgi:hypothetical protein
MSSTRPAPQQSPLMSVYSGRDCIGFILARGKSGFEAFDRDDKSLGLFRTQDMAADAITTKTGESKTPAGQAGAL